MCLSPRNRAVKEVHMIVGENQTFYFCSKLCYIMPHFLKYYYCQYFCHWFHKIKYWSIYSNLDQRFVGLSGFNSVPCSKVLFSRAIPSSLVQRSVLWGISKNNIKYNYTYNKIHFVCNQGSLYFESSLHLGNVNSHEQLMEFSSNFP